MSDERFKSAKGSLAFSQGLRDRMRAAQQPPQDPEMAPEAPPAPEQGMPPQAPAAPPAEQPAEAPAAPVEAPETPQEDSKDLGSTLKAGMQGMEKFFSSIGDYFKNEEQRGEVSRQKEEETMKKLKGIEKSLKEIVED